MFFIRKCLQEIVRKKITRMEDLSLHESARMHLEKYLDLVGKSNLLLKIMTEINYKGYWMEKSIDNIAGDKISLWLVQDPSVIFHKKPYLCL